VNRKTWPGIAFGDAIPRLVWSEIRRENDTGVTSQKFLFNLVNEKGRTGAPASWTAAAICRFGSRDVLESGRGLPQSKTLRRDPVSRLFAVKKH